MEKKKIETEISRTNYQIIGENGVICMYLCLDNKSFFSF